MIETLAGIQEHPFAPKPQKIEFTPVVNCTEQRYIPSTFFCPIVGEKVKVNDVGVCKKVEEGVRCIYRTH